MQGTLERERHISYKVIGIEETKAIILWHLIVEKYRIIENTTFKYRGTASFQVPFLLKILICHLVNTDN